MLFSALVFCAALSATEEALIEEKAFTEERALFVSPEEAERLEEDYLRRINSNPLHKKSKNQLFVREHLDGNSAQDYAHSQKVFLSLVSSKASRIRFNSEKLYPFDYAGTCSAMSLDFLTRYIIAKETSANVAAIKSKVKLFRPYHRDTNTTFLSRQAAFNTIEILPQYRLTSFKEQEKNKLAKMHSLARFHKIELSAATESISMSLVQNGVVNSENQRPSRWILCSQAACSC